MLETILAVLKTMGWLGLVLLILVLTNTICGTLYNIFHKNQDFSWKKLGKGLLLAVIFYLTSAMVAVAFAMLPFINEMISNSFGVLLLSDELLQSLSSVGVLGVVVSTIVIQGKKALEGILNLTNIKADNEIITWEVYDNEEEEEKIAE